MILRWSDIGDFDTGEYRRLFEESFGYYDEAHLPGVTMIAQEAGVKIGFVTGYWRSKRCFHILYAGITKANSNPVRTGKLLKLAVDMVESASCLMVIENHNRPAMMAAFRAGFTPIGTRIEHGICCVEWLREVENGQLLQ